MRNKRGQLTILISLLLVGLFLGSILLLVGGLVSYKFNQALDIDVDIGQVNLADTNRQTIGKFNEMVLVNADWWGMSLIFGMIIGLFLSSYILRGSFPKWALVLDIFIILFIFLISLYISSFYQTLLDILASIDETFLEEYTSSTSMFILNLPVFVVVIGCVMMVLFHSSIPKKTEENIQQGGFLQGV